MQYVALDLAVNSNFVLWNYVRMLLGAPTSKLKIHT